MTTWINGGGFYLVQSSEPYCVERIRSEMDELEMKLRVHEQIIEQRHATSIAQC